MTTTHPMTARILERFESLNRVPRPSGHEEAIRDWILEWAREQNLPARQDAAGNIVVEAPASPGRQNAPVVVIQGHLDMVCEKTPDSDHDFSKDPIRHVMDGEWLRADRTTLGADNGIAIAMAMALAETEPVDRPPLELLFTVEEETGLNGAKALTGDFIRGRLLLNVDSEDEGVFTIGCAGGQDTEITLDVVSSVTKETENLVRMRLAAVGMRGGHSGIDIGLGRANAIVVLARALAPLMELGAGIESIAGGTAHNAIPREAEAIVWIDRAQADEAKTRVALANSQIATEYRVADPNLSISIEEAPKEGLLFGVSDDYALRALRMLLALPHGVEAMSLDIPGLVETSNNLARVELDFDGCRIVTSQRSASDSRLAALSGKIRAVADLAGASTRAGSGYPPWEPRHDSALLARAKTVYQSLFDREPKVEIIHAGLECAQIGSNIAGMDMISFGPTVKNAHSPQERLLVSAVGEVWDFLVALLRDIK